jgi:hypothetical protein
MSNPAKKLDWNPSPPNRLDSYFKTHNLVSRCFNNKNYIPTSSFNYLQVCGEDDLPTICIG